MDSVPPKGGYGEGVPSPSSPKRGYRGSRNPPLSGLGFHIPQKEGTGMTYHPLLIPPQKGGTGVTRDPPPFGDGHESWSTTIYQLPDTRPSGQGVFWRLAPPMHYPYHEAKQESNPCREDIATAGDLVVTGWSVIEYIRVVLVYTYRVFVQYYPVFMVQFSRVPVNFVDSSVKDFWPESIKIG